MSCNPTTRSQVGFAILGLLVALSLAVIGYGVAYVTVGYRAELKGVVVYAYDDSRYARLFTPASRLEGILTGKDVFVMGLD